MIIIFSILWFIIGVWVGLSGEPIGALICFGVSSILSALYRIE
jgi:uncharacterized MnhB-related membrane protein